MLRGKGGAAGQQADGGQDKRRIEREPPRHAVESSFHAILMPSETLWRAPAGPVKGTFGKVVMIP
ncbi:hypothetical protein DM50_3605 [Burkholderia mallei]|nr:hypothetical protein DM50_3605 [Burkholderia mallei]KOT11541.1 hypothetical protein DM77_3119 [Burkholderia mallei]